MGPNCCDLNVTMDMCAFTHEHPGTRRCTSHPCTLTISLHGCLSRQTADNQSQERHNRVYHKLSVTSSMRTNARMAPYVTQTGRSNRRVTAREVLTDHQHRAQQKVRDLGDGGSSSINLCVLVMLGALRRDLNTSELHCTSGLHRLGVLVELIETSRSLQPILHTDLCLLQGGSECMASVPLPVWRDVRIEWHDMTLRVITLHKNTRHSIPFHGLAWPGLAWPGLA